MYGTIASGSSSKKLDATSLAPPEVAPSPFRYAVQEGDSLARIAAKLHTTEAQLLALNPMLAPPASSSRKQKHKHHRTIKVYPGQQLVVDDARHVSLPPPPEVIDNGWGQMHVVRAGESLESIAAQYNTHEALLRQDNRQFFPAGERGVLVAGQMLHVRIVNTGSGIDDAEDVMDHAQAVRRHSASSPSTRARSSAKPVVTASTTASVTKYKSHVVARSDSFESICRAYSITYAQLLQMNRGRYPVGARAVLVPGDKLIVPDAAATHEATSRRNVAEVTLTKQIHVVAVGETPEAIAATYRMTLDELREFNRAYFPKGYRGDIRAGYKLVVKRVVVAQEHDDDQEETDSDDDGDGVDEYRRGHRRSSSGLDRDAYATIGGDSSDASDSDDEP